MTGSRESLSFKSQKRYVLIAALTLFLVAGLSIAFLTRKSSVTSQELAAANLDKALENQRTPWFSSVDKQYVYLPISRQVEERDDPEPLGSREDLKNPFFEKLFTGVLPACFFTVVLGVLLWIFIRKTREKSLSKRLRLEELARRQRRLETLADEAKSRYDDLKGAALEAYNSGDFRSAIIFYFSWILVEADKRELIWLDKGKTNLEYWRELDRNPEVQRIYRVIMNEFELVYYGGRSISRRTFEDLWENQTPFEELMSVEDEKIANREQEAETMKIRNNAKNWAAPKFHLLLALFVCSMFTLVGCKENEWRYPYGHDTNVAPHNGLNSLSAFCEYCRLTTKEKVYALERDSFARETFPFTRGDYDDCNTIVWFMCVDWIRGAWKLPCDPIACETEDAEDESRELDDDESFLSNDLDLWRQTLEAYATATPEDWPFFYVPESSAALDGFSYYLHPVYDFNSSSNSPRKGIEVWLREKPGRKVVIVLASSNSTLNYWTKIRELANERFEDPLKQKALEDCREIFSDYADVDFEGNSHSSRRAKGESAIRAHTMASNILDASLLLTILDAAPDLIETPQDLTNALRRDKLDLTDEFEASFEHEYGSESLADLKASIRKLVEDFNRSEYSADADFVARESVFRNERSPWGSSWGYKEPCYSTAWDEEERWFVQRHLLPRDEDEEEKRSFSGLTSWTSCLPESAPFREDFQLVPGEGTEVLLLHGDSPLVCRRAEGEGEILFVNSASFMTNFAMTEEAGRAFVRRLTQEFLDNGPIGLTFSPFDYPPVVQNYKYDPPQLDGRFSVAQRSVFTEFVWRLTLLGTVILFCFWPIFGRPRRRVESKSSDFTLHLDAYAQLLKRVDSTRWTHDQLDKYTGKRRGEDKVNHGKKKTGD
ncbi:MAG: hypothetical protein ACI4NP_01855 [Thermoguttaceae bacterium]